MAQDIQSSTKSFSLNINGVYGSWSSESFFLGDLDDQEPVGVGFSARAGYGFNENIEAFISFSSMGFKRELEWDTYKLTNLNIGGRYNFGATLRRFRPFVEAAVSFNNLHIDPITFDGISIFDLQSSGVGGAVGGGVHFFILPNLSANANGRFIFGNFSSTTLSGSDVDNLDETLDFSITTIHVGLTYFFE